MAARALRPCAPSARPHGPNIALDAVAPGKQLPRQPRALDAVAIEQEKGALIVQRRVAPFAVGDQDVAGKVGRIASRREQDRLRGIVIAAGKAVGKEACLALVPQQAIEPRQQGLVFGDDEQALPLPTSRWPTDATTLSAVASPNW